MSITEALMGTGGFEVSLRSDVPWEIRSRLEPFGYICVTPLRIPIAEIDVQDIRNSSLYTGFIDQVIGDMRTLKGRGLAALLGDQLRGDRDDGDPTNNPEHLIYGDTTPVDIGELFTDRNAAYTDSAWSPFNVNDLNEDADNLFPTTALDPNTPPVYPILDFGLILPHTRDLMDLWFSTLSPLTSHEWRIGPNGVVRIELPADLWADGAVMFSEDLGDSQGVDGSNNPVRTIFVAESEIVALDGSQTTTGWRVTSVDVLVIYRFSIGSKTGVE